MNMYISQMLTEKDKIELEQFYRIVPKVVGVYFLKRGYKKKHRRLQTVSHEKILNNSHNNRK